MTEDIINSAILLFEEFWEASVYSEYNIRQFALVQEQFNAKEKEDSILEYPSEPMLLKLPKSDLLKITKGRKCERDFSKEALTKNELSTLMSSFYAMNDLEHRTYPSAGASYALEIFCVANNVEGLSNSVLYYNPDLHAVTKITDAPSWKDIDSNNYFDVINMPQCIFIFVLMSDRITEKYSERGGRFALIEAGAALQQLALNIAESKNLKGFPAGGFIDDYWIKLLNLDSDNAKIAISYLVGK